ncbi:MAG: MinD/ParA family protein [Lachnospiraceae bacterium]|jgi:flagellar biosynthesis protein FlhG|nr:MinD/ParA family protein [Lachnospiraceae bacterium]MCI8986034.1 MinD/ParA family protein [Lachnospiraceae bacterium]MCI9013372.1 MinD/ParA family protein [Lachnospiraceae bacterium]MCI9253724.1 MinD/ParA family protein [Lachnospiraceae bacterium]
MDQAEQLRNIIKANNQPQRPLARVITVTSGKGGVGKSNTAINLAIQFRKMGQRVIILDADFGLANIEIMFGAVPKHNLCDLIYQGKNIKEIITWGPMEVGFISGGSGIAGMSNLSRDYLNYIVQNLVQLDEMADTIIIDTGAGISDAVLEFLVASGEILLVTTPEPTSITDSYSLLKALNRHPRYSGETTSVKVIANKVADEEEAKALFAKLEAVVVRYLRVPVTYLGMIPQDQLLARAVMQQMPVSLENPRARSTLAYEELAAKLMNKELNRNLTKRGMAAFFSHIIGKR